MPTDDTADMDKHSDEELAEGLEKVAEQRPRLEQEGTEEQLRAQEVQKRAMEEELEQRDSGLAPSSDEGEG